MALEKKLLNHLIVESQKKLNDYQAVIEKGKAIGEQFLSIPDIKYIDFCKREVPKIKKELEVLYIKEKCPQKDCIYRIPYKLDIQPQKNTLRVEFYIKNTHYCGCRLKDKRSGFHSSDFESCII